MTYAYRTSASQFSKRFQRVLGAALSLTFLICAAGTVTAELVSYCRYNGSCYHSDIVELYFSVVVEDDSIPAGPYRINILGNGTYANSYLTFNVNSDHSVSAPSVHNVGAMSSGNCSALVWEVTSDGKLRLTDGTTTVGTAKGGNAFFWAEIPGPCSTTTLHPTIVFTVNAKCDDANGGGGSGNGTASGDGFAPGYVGLGIDSINLQIGLGVANDFLGVAKLYLRVGSPYTNMAAPRALNLWSSGSVTKISDTNGLRQVLTSQVLADILTNNPYNYDIWLYQSNNAGIFTNGLYHPDSSNSFKKVTVENPDASATNYSRLSVTVLEGNVTNLYT